MISKFKLAALGSAIAVSLLTFCSSPAKAAEPDADVMVITPRQRAACEDGGGCLFISRDQFIAAVEAAAEKLAAAKVEKIRRGINWKACTGST